jgi:LMBR1 domain-containing protein 1
MAIMSFAGWILLILFGGVGLYALPIDLINEYRRRPRPRKSNLMKATR